MHPLSSALCEKKIDSARLVPVAASKEGIRVEEDRMRSLVPRRLKRSIRTAFGTKTREKRKLSWGRRLRCSSAMTHELSMVQRSSRIRSAAVRRREDKQAEREGSQSQKDRLCILPCIDGFEMLDYSDLSLVRIARIDHYKVRPKVWLQLRREHRVRHD